MNKFGRLGRLARKISPGTVNSTEVAPTAFAPTGPTSMAELVIPESLAENDLPLMLNSLERIARGEIESNEILAQNTSILLTASDGEIQELIRFFREQGRKFLADVLEKFDGIRNGTTNRAGHPIPGIYQSMESDGLVKPTRKQLYAFLEIALQESVDGEWQGRIETFNPSPKELEALALMIHGFPGYRSSNTYGTFLTTIRKLKDCSLEVGEGAILKSFVEVLGSASDLISNRRVQHYNIDG